MYWSWWCSVMLAMVFPTLPWKWAIFLSLDSTVGLPLWVPSSLLDKPAQLWIFVHCDSSSGRPSNACLDCTDVHFCFKCCYSVRILNMCTNRIYLLSSFFLFAFPCLCHGGSFYIIKAYLPCTLQHWANLWCQFRRKSCENFPESYKSVHLGSWHLRGLQTGLLTSYFILCLYPIATQTQPYSAIVCLKMWLVRGMKGAGLLSRTFQYLVRSCFFSSSVRIHLHSHFTPVKVSLLM